MRTYINSRTYLRRLLTTTAAGGLLAAVVACGGPVDPPIEEPGDEVVETEPSQPESEGEAEQETEPAQEAPPSTAELPADFPNDVPLPDLPLSHAEDYPPELKTWDLFFAVNDQAADFAVYVMKLEKADFTHALEPEEGEEVTGAMMEQGSYLLTISQSDDPDFNPSLRVIVKDSAE